MSRNEKEPSIHDLGAGQNFQNIPNRNSSSHHGVNPNGPNFADFSKNQQNPSLQTTMSDSSKLENQKVEKPLSKRNALKKDKKEAKLKKKQEKLQSKQRLKEHKILAKEEKRKLKSKASFSSKFRDFFKIKVAVGTLIIIVCFLAVFVVSPFISGLVAKRVPVVKLSTDLLKGSMIMEENIEVTTIAEFDIPLNAAVSKEQILGAFVKSDLYAGDIVTASKLSKTRPLENPYLYDLGEGRIALSVSVEGLAESLSGKLKSGDVVSIFTVLDQSQKEIKESKDLVFADSYPELRYVKVLAITNSHTKDINVDDVAIDAKDNDIVPSTLTLEVHPYQARILAGLNKNAIIHIGLVVRSEQEDVAAAYLNAQFSFIDELIIAEEANRRALGYVDVDDSVDDYYGAGEVDTGDIEVKDATAGEIALNTGDIDLKDDSTSGEIILDEGDGLKINQETSTSSIEGEDVENG